LGQPLLAWNKQKPYMWCIAAGALTNVVLNILLIPLYGIAGAAAATGLSVITYNIVKLVYVWIKFRMQPFTLRSLGMLLNGCIVLLLSFLIPEFSNIFVDIIIRSGLMTAAYVLLIWLLDLSPEFKNAAREFIRKLSAR
jgi:O-antigen/teichoic acid export membrane protein